MDVSKPLRGLGLVAMLLALIGCSDNETIQTVFPEQDICSQTNVPNKFIVQWKDGTYSVEHAKDRKSFIEDFLEDHLEEVEYVQHDQLIQPLPVSPQTVQSNNILSGPEIYGPYQIEADSAWTRNIKGDGITVAVIDSGVDVNHPLLQSQILYNSRESGVDAQGNDRATNGIDDDGNGLIDDYAGYDFYDDGPLSSFSDADEHGTHVAGIVAAYHDQNFIDSDGVQGIAPKAKILPLKFIGPNGGHLSDAMKAIDYAVARGARVINASWGGSACSKSLEQKLQSLSNFGVLFVAAAGNNGSNIDKLFEFPASFNMPSQITVGSVTRDLHVAQHSNYGDERVHVFAPGHRIVSTLPGQRIGEMTGTSMAAPFVTGMAALLLSHRPTATVDEVRLAILNSVVKDPFYRNATQGRINVSNALNYLDSQ